MKPRLHHYALTVEWTGNLGQGTSGYRAYTRDHSISSPGKAVIAGSSDPAFRGDPSRHNPEELLVASLSACHMLWYLHLCAEAGIVVTGYVDRPSGTMLEASDGGGQFSEVILKPEITIAGKDQTDLARALHARAHQLCFIARSVNFPVRCEPSIQTG